MIVAPLMTPILGMVLALALVLGRRRSMLRSLAYVMGGALLVIAVGFAFGALDPIGLVSQTNTQVIGRVNPRLIDLIAALATGSVGAFALVRSDVSDTLSGVAIAISLVPPLGVVGLLLEAGRYPESLGALLLFGANVTAIIVTGTVGLLFYRVRDGAQAGGVEVGELRGHALAIIAGLVVLVAVPLGSSTSSLMTFTSARRVHRRPRPGHTSAGDGRGEQRHLTALPAAHLIEPLNGSRPSMSCSAEPSWEMLGTTLQSSIVRMSIDMTSKALPVATRKGSRRR